ncbi:hypothetical protein FKW77_008906 [Venturia effusa]|uniref:Beta-xylosidase C-terminal Concanavalin A-like domain-containing protein n=1 Tax=Venturia effusa TaxID=50376 RepID=A0A517LCT6_9PEZI|nr:hypothetical protein FKW77_008906 [Venturia effusa]
MKSTLASLASTVSFLTALTNAVDVQVTLSNKTPVKFDSNGSGPLDVAFGPVFSLNGTYRWIGAASTYAHCSGTDLPLGKCGLRSYASVDLMTWNDEGIFADLADPAFINYRGRDGLDLGRPHIIFNAATQLYILWANNAGAFATFTSPTPLGPWTEKGRVPVPVQFGGDFTVRNVSGSAYISYSAFNFSAAGTIWPPFEQSQVLQELTSDYTNITGPMWSITSAANDIVDRMTEAADLWERDGLVYWTGSLSCGNCNDGLMVAYRTKDIRSNIWERQIISADTCGGQTGGVLATTNSAGEKNYIAAADLWDGDGTLRLHGKNLQPLYFNDDGSLKDLNCDPSAVFNFSIARGAGVENSGKSASFTDGSDPNQNYTFGCDLSRNNFYQTWQNSKSGVLKEVGVNLGAQNTTTPILLGVYAYKSNSDFLTPSVKFENLYNITLSWDEVPTGTGLVAIQPNVTVAAGDRLALFVVAPSNPAGGVSEAGNYCYLSKAAGSEFNVNTSTTTLFTNLVGDVSPKGIDGKDFPIKVTGRELSWHSIVE